jgi:hypothetical protein
MSNRESSSCLVKGKNLEWFPGANTSATSTTASSKQSELYSAKGTNAEGSRMSQEISTEEENRKRQKMEGS